MALPDLQLRSLVETDLLAYKALRDRMLADFPESFTSDAETERSRDLASYRSRLSGGAAGGTLFTVVALDRRAGGRLVGALTAEREARQKVQHTAHLVGMMVAPDCQGRGIGRALLSETVARLRTEPGISLVTLSVTADNLPAVRVYERCGFERYGCLRGAIRLPDGRELDKALMSLRLT